MVDVLILLENMAGCIYVLSLCCIYLSEKCILVVSDRNVLVLGGIRDDFD